MNKPINLSNTVHIELKNKISTGDKLYWRINLELREFLWDKIYLKLNDNLNYNLMIKLEDSIERDLENN